MDMPWGGAFVAINAITCRADYVERLRELFLNRARLTDRRPGFRGMVVLEPHEEGAAYLVISQWEDEAAFHAWIGSPEFAEGHRRVFADIATARLRGDDPPLLSDFSTYSVLAR